MISIFFFKNLLKSFFFGIFSKAGRNFLGRICVRHQGGGHKLKAIKVDRFRYINSFGLVLKILTDFYHTGYLGLILYDVV